ncbi:hypothetical protein BGW80DRAFT_1447028 [Lactifluus volemus]|nr:hypothetical protein BGW80DRAFT_1447028 [Lactifluus volemus]
MLTEYEQAKEENDRPKMGLWKRQQKRKTGVGDYSLGVFDISNTYLTIQHMPFPLPYPDSALASGHVLRQAPRALAISAGVATYIIRRRHPPQTSRSGASPSVRRHSAAQRAQVPGGPPGPLNSPPPSCTSALGEHVLKKIISVLLKDLDVFAQNSIKDELASLDPLLRNVGGWSVPVGNGDEGRTTYEFDPEHK